MYKSIFFSDQEFHQLVKSWLIMITCVEPVITKAFEVHQLVGGGGAASNKVWLTFPGNTPMSTQLNIAISFFFISFINECLSQDSPLEF